MPQMRCVFTGAEPWRRTRKTTFGSDGHGSRTKSFGKRRHCIGGVRNCHVMVVVSYKSGSTATVKWLRGSVGRKPCFNASGGALWRSRRSAWSFGLASHRVDAVPRVLEQSAQRRRLNIRCHHRCHRSESASRCLQLRAPKTGAPHRAQRAEEDDGRTVCSPCPLSGRFDCVRQRQWNPTSTACSLKRR